MVFALMVLSLVLYLMHRLNVVQVLYGFARPVQRGMQPRVMPMGLDFDNTATSKIIHQNVGEAGEKDQSVIKYGMFGLAA